MAGAEDSFAILRSMSAATIWEAAGKRGDMSPRIKPLFAEARVAGPAFTVKMFPGETLAAVRAVDAAPAGSVIVIDAGAAERGVSWGGTATFAASRKGIAGLVTNGTVRDLAEILDRKFSVFATGASLVAGLRGHPGWLEIPISIGEVVVHPGDFIVGDLDGVVVVPAAQVVEVAQRAVVQRDREVEREKMLLRGATLMDVLKSG
jgi:4-hydroxy-4-methyl-2-oxoglutarate aldolase